MSDAGSALMGIGRALGENRAVGSRRGRPPIVPCLRCPLTGRRGFSSTSPAAKASACTRWKTPRVCTVAVTNVWHGSRGTPGRIRPPVVSLNVSWISTTRSSRAFQNPGSRRTTTTRSGCSGRSWSSGRSAGGTALRRTPVSTRSS